MVNFTLCVFHHNHKKGTKDRKGGKSWLEKDFCFKHGNFEVYTLTV